MKPYFETPFATLFNCDVRAGLAALPSNSVDCRDQKELMG